jgi:predicted DNA-binding transcriptional regulator AlpA
LQRGTAACRPAVEAAKRLNRSRSWFYKHREKLRRRGFPDPLPVVDRWDAAAIDAWRLRQATMCAAVRNDEEDAALDAAFGL